MSAINHAFALLIIGTTSVALTSTSARAAYIGAGVIVVAVGFSRLYLGVHYPSDVLGGFCAGLGWLSACSATRRFVAERRLHA